MSEFNINLVDKPYATKAEAIGPKDIPSDAKQWTTWLKNSVPNLKGDMIKAGKLLHAFQEGINFVWERQRDILKPDTDQIAKFSFLIALSDKPFMPPIGVYSVFIYIDKNFLESYLKFPLKFIIKDTQKYLDGSKMVRHIGTTIDFFRLTGVEEATEFLLTKIIPGKKREFVPSWHMTGSQYDAEEFEYISLKMKLLYARKNKLSPVTIDVLTQRLKDARIYRKEVQNLINTPKSGSDSKMEQGLDS